MNLCHLVFLVILSIASQGIAKTPKNVAITFDPSIAENVNLKTAWLSYAGYLAKWAIAPEHAQHICNHGKPLPFDAELYARTLLITDAWTKLKSTDAQAIDEYLDALSQIQKAGFMSEYVWKYHRQTGWEKPAVLREAEFDAWEAENLPALKPVTLSGMRPKC